MFGTITDALIAMQDEIERLDDDFENYDRKTGVNCALNNKKDRVRIWNDIRKDIPEAPWEEINWCKALFFHADNVRYAYEQNEYGKPKPVPQWFVEAYKHLFKVANSASKSQDEDLSEMSSIYLDEITPPAAVWKEGIAMVLRGEFQPHCYPIWNGVAMDEFYHTKDKITIKIPKPEPGETEAEVTVFTELVDGNIPITTKAFTFKYM